MNGLFHLKVDGIPVTIVSEAPCHKVIKLATLIATSVDFTPHSEQVDRLTPVLKTRSVPTVEIPEELVVADNMRITVKFSCNRFYTFHCMRGHDRPLRVEYEGPLTDGSRGTWIFVAEQLDELYALVF